MCLAGEKCDTYLLCAAWVPLTVVGREVVMLFACVGWRCVWMKVYGNGEKRVRLLFTYSHARKYDARKKANGNLGANLKVFMYSPSYLVPVSCSSARDSTMVDRKCCLACSLRNILGTGCLAFIKTFIDRL
jgi:hypothetical protein